MKTIQEQISIMQAYADGKEIEVRVKSNIISNWLPEDKPTWNWEEYDYRVKPEPPKKKIVPYDSAEEFLAAQKEHGMYLYKPNSASLYFPVRVNPDEIGILDITIRHDVSGTYVSYSELVNKKYSWQDRTPCGKEVENGYTNI